MMFGSLVAGAVAAALTGRVLWGVAVALWLLIGRAGGVAAGRSRARGGAGGAAVVGYVRGPEGRVVPYVATTRFGPQRRGGELR